LDQNVNPAGVALLECASAPHHLGWLAHQNSAGANILPPIRFASASENVDFCLSNAITFRTICGVRRRVERIPSAPINCSIFRTGERGAEQRWKTMSSRDPLPSL
jgi:hypothetical protein